MKRRKASEVIDTLYKPKSDSYEIQQLVHLTASDDHEKAEWWLVGRYCLILTAECLQFNAVNISKSLRYYIQFHVYINWEQCYLILLSELFW